MKTCPFDNRGLCQLADCALWNDTSEACIFILLSSIAESLYTISGNIEEVLGQKVAPINE